MEEEGVRIYLGESIERIEEGKKKRVYLSGGERIECDFLLFACGTKANAELAKEAGIECGTTGAVKVDEFGETAKEGVFATGECAEGVDFVNGAPTVAKTGSIATLQGKIVAENILGRRRKLPPILFSLLTDVFGFQIAALGTREMEDAVVGRFEGGVKDKFYPQTENIKIKILVQRGSGRILGAQMVGDEVFARALSLQFAMQAGVDVDALSFYQTMYVPSICATFEPLILAAQAARRYA
jgi:NADH oxidase (H2O2-forming)